MTTDRDMNDVMDRLTESPDDIVLVDNGVPFTRCYCELMDTFTMNLTVSLSKHDGNCLKIIRPFTDADGERWTPDDLTS